MTDIDEIKSVLRQIAADHKLDPADHSVMAALLDAAAYGMQRTRKLFTRKAT